MSNKAARMSSGLDKRIKELTFLLTEMKGLHEGLREAIQRKLGAMRSADTDAIHAAAQRERELADRIRKEEGLRQVLMERIGQSMGIGAVECRKMTVGSLAERVDEPAKSRLLVLGNELREVASEVARLNRVAGLVSSEMVRHFRNIYSTFNRGGVDRAVYGNTGRPKESAMPAMIDTTG